ncbi:hypothetical protein FBY31_3841 [Arthrobacter sp. SLBN-100]|nr:hypothetical protein FBY31_3841 [Arthrobacter sp. SLBN-100]
MDGPMDDTVPMNGPEMPNRCRSSISRLTTRPTGRRRPGPTRIGTVRNSVRFTSCCGLSGSSPESFSLRNRHCVAGTATCPQASRNEFPLVRRVRVETALLAVRHNLDAEAGSPHHKAAKRPPVQPHPGGGRNRNPGGGRGEDHPEPLQRPRVQETEERRLELIEPVVLAVPAHAAEQEASQPRQVGGDGGGGGVASSNGHRGDRHARRSCFPLRHDAADTYG